MEGGCVVFALRGVCVQGIVSVRMGPEQRPGVCEEPLGLVEISAHDILPLVSISHLSSELSLFDL